VTIDREENLHRNNAAEWVMWVCLLPVVAIARVFGRRNSQHVK